MLAPAPIQAEDEIPRERRATRRGRPTPIPASGPRSCCQDARMPGGGWTSVVTCSPHDAPRRPRQALRWVAGLCWVGADVDGDAHQRHGADQQEYSPTTITAGASRRSRRRPTRDSARGDDAARKPWQSRAMSSATVYWRPGCPFCLKLRLGLRLTRTPHQLVDVREDPEASAFVKRHNGGDEVVPTVAVGDRVLNNPSVREIQRALAGL